MDNSQKTTAFSAHLSWAAMRRFLQEKLSSEESKEIELHLKHCPQCSSAIIDYIQTEEPQNYKQYMKKIKGHLISSQTAKKRFFSAFQLKAIRTTTAVVALLIFSFFAFKTIISQQDTNRPLPSESLAVMKKSPKAATTRRKASKATAEQPKAAIETPQKAPAKKKPVEKKPIVKKEAVKKKEPAASEAVVVPEKKKVQPKALPVQADVAPDAKKEASEKKVETSIPAAKAPDSAPQSEEKATTEEPAAEVVKAKPVPTLEKLDAKESTQSVAPLGGNRPTTIPVPGNQIRER